MTCVWFGFLDMIDCVIFLYLILCITCYQWISKCYVVLTFYFYFILKVFAKILCVSYFALCVLNVFVKCVFRLNRFRLVVQF
jgi:hypothetical protein